MGHSFVFNDLKITKNTKNTRNNMSTLGCPLAIVTTRMTTCWGHPEITAKGDNPTSPAESGHFFCYVDPFLGTKICTIFFLQFFVQPLLKLFNAGMSFPRCLTETLQTSSMYITFALTAAVQTKLKPASKCPCLCAGRSYQARHPSSHETDGWTKSQL